MPAQILHLLNLAQRGFCIHNKPMNSRLRFMVMALCIVLSLPSVLSAENLTVNYLEGTLESRIGSSWMARYIGDTISDTAILRLSGGGFAELDMNGTTITLIRDGEYQIAVLVEQSLSQGDIRDFLDAIPSLLKGRRKEGAVAGTRADEVPGKDWFMTDAQARDAADGLTFQDSGYLQDGIFLMDEGDLKGAAYKFYEGQNQEFSDEARRECTFRLGLCSQLAGELRYAREKLLSIEAEANPGDTYYDEYVVTVAVLRIESMEYIEAEELLNRYLATGPAGEHADAALYLLGLLD